MTLAGLGITERSTQAQIDQTWVIEQSEPDPIGALERIIGTNGGQEPSTDAGWLVMLSYELGRIIEPKAQHCKSQIAQVHPTHPGLFTESSSDFPAAVLQRWTSTHANQAHHTGSYEIGPVESSMGKARYLAGVERTKAYIRAGDLYQANIAHHLQGSFSGSARSCFADLASAADPKYGSMMVFDHQGIRHAILSISPELFVEVDPSSRLIRTEPMKGTRPIGADVAELRDSVKDRAELDMITDLMRNDLGRVCTLGSVEVVEPRKIESHQSGVLQASAVIEGRLAEGVGFAQIIKATFAPGSVTGAPKVRAMQIIDEIEHHPRDSYCGAMVVLDDAGAIKGSVSIRTAHIWGEPAPDGPDSIKDGQLSYPVGAGVVADSDPDAEWAETLMKAAILRSALGIEIGE